MQLAELRIENYRCFKDETIAFDSYNCFVGPNGAGKSTVLTALNVLFRHDEGPGSVTKMSKEDFHLSNTGKPIRITGTFTDIDDLAQEEFKTYVRQGQLVITSSATWDDDEQAAIVEQYGQRLVMSEFKRYFDADKEGLKADELKEIYRGLREDYPALPNVWVKADMKNALREYEEAHPDDCELEQSKDQFYGWSRGADRLEKFMQWVYIPAVKEVSEEQEEAKNTALGQLLDRTIRQKVDFSEEIERLKEELGERYQAMISEQNSVLDGVGKALQTRLREWSHGGARIDLKWHYDPDGSVSINQPSAQMRLGEGPFLGEVLRSGHGMQRSLLLSLLHELAAGEQNLEIEPTLILAIEEPELYQHPPQARHLRSVLESLAHNGSQVIITTHSPYFVSARGVPSVRMTKRSARDSAAHVTSVSLVDISNRLANALEDKPQEPTELMSKIHQIMQPSQRELFFSRVPVLVEGLEDVAFLSTHLHLAGLWDEFRRLGCHFVQCGGKGPMSRPLAVALSFGIPTFCVFDADADETNEGRLEKHRADNQCLLRLLSYDDDPIQETNLWRPQAVMWQTKIMKEIRKDVGEDEWDSAVGEARQANSMIVGVKGKDALLVTATLETLWERGESSTLLDKATQAILSYAKEVALQEVIEPE